MQRLGRARIPDPCRGPNPAAVLVGIAVDRRVGLARGKHADDVVAGFDDDAQRLQSGGFLPGEEDTQSVANRSGHGSQRPAIYAVACRSV